MIEAEILQSEFVYILINNNNKHDKKTSYIYFSFYFHHL